MSGEKKNVFLIGPGFIGGSLLVKLKETRPDLNLRALTRREEQASDLRKLGIEPILGGLEDAATIKKAVQEAEIIIHTATADDAASAFAIVEGIKERKNKEKKMIYIQTSGNDELAFSAKSLSGTSIEERTLSDARGDDVLENGRILPDAYHRHVDGPLRERLFNDQAEKEHNVSTTIMMPPLIYGIGVEPWKRISIQTPMLTSTMIKNGLFTLPENFKGAWNSVWVHDLVDTYLILLKELESHKPGDQHPSHYLFPAEEKVFFWKEIFDAIVKTLKKYGFDGNVKVIEDKKTLESLIATTVPEYAPCFGQVVFGSDNSYTKPDRLYNLGYKHTAKGPVDSILNGAELDNFIKEELKKNAK